jgi:hypothetical protein
MGTYHQIALEAWLALAHPDTPPLPWIADNGAEICSFAIYPIRGTAGTAVVLYDAHCRQVGVSGNRAAINATAAALGRRADELTFLPTVDGISRRVPGDSD